jgi:hypothetical protein
VFDSKDTNSLSGDSKEREARKERDKKKINLNISHRMKKNFI